MKTMRQRSGSVLALAVLFGATVALAGLAVPGCKKKTVAKTGVTCARSAKGIACRVSLGKATKAAKICWDVTLECRNGTKVIGGGCQVVKPGATATALIPADELPDHEKCDAVARSVIQNVRQVDELK